MNQIFILGNATARGNAVRAVLKAPDGYQIKVGEPTRNLEQNARFHAVCASLEKSGVKWGGKTLDAMRWKNLLISGHTIATGGEVEVMEGLEGELLNIRESTSQMTKSRKSSLIEYAEAFCATQI